MKSGRGFPVAVRDLDPGSKSPRSGLSRRPGLLFFFFFFLSFSGPCHPASLSSSLVLALQRLRERFLFSFYPFPCPPFSFCSRRCCCRATRASSLSRRVAPCRRMSSRCCSLRQEHVQRLSVRGRPRLAFGQEVESFGQCPQLPRLPHRHVRLVLVAQNGEVLGHRHRWLEEKPRSWCKADVRRRVSFIGGDLGFLLS